MTFFISYFTSPALKWTAYGEIIYSLFISCSSSVYPIMENVKGVRMTVWDWIGDGDSLRLWSFVMRH
jgi:hypothetical protein